MMKQLQWNTACLLWDKALEDKRTDRFRQPAILRFDRDTFMEDLETQLSSKGPSIKHLVVRSETWRDERAGWLNEDEIEAGPIKLYQPVQSRFYLVMANLVCRLPGLPDKSLDSSKEKVSFVVRRLVPHRKAPGGTVEYCWSTDGKWVEVETPKSVLDTEERLPLFPMPFRNNGRCHKPLAGLIPVSKREAYQATAPVAAEDAAGTPGEGAVEDPRIAYFEATAVNSFGELLRILKASYDYVTGGTVQATFLMGLLDMSLFVAGHLGGDWNSVSNVKGGEFFSGVTWSEALKKIYGRRKDIIEGNLTDLRFVSSDWPSSKQGIVAAVGNALNRLKMLDKAAGEYRLNDSFRQNLETALAKHPLTGSDIEKAVGMPDVDRDRAAVYVIRCVLERPGCALFPPVVSEASCRLRFAPFFDPDAPARPVRIAMPVDTSIKGLRKFPKNVSVLISEQLRKQMNRVKGVSLEDLDKGAIKGEEAGPDFAMICTLSIPIITICALILLMIIVQLLNIVFWWLPYFKICLPIRLGR
jgi:hypothetical protein